MFLGLFSKAVIVTNMYVLKCFWKIQKIKWPSDTGASQNKNKEFVFLSLFRFMTLTKLLTSELVNSFVCLSKFTRCSTKIAWSDFRAKSVFDYPH